MSRPISDPVFDIGRDLQRAYDEGYKQRRYDEKVETETSLPSGEQTHALRTETHACDLIKRQDAIDVLHGYFDGMLETDTVCPADIYGLFECIPSAQPEIIRCKDCKYQDENRETFSTCNPVVKADEGRGWSERMVKNEQEL